MNDILENKLSRSIAVAGFLRHFESVWSGNAVLGDCVTELEGLIDQVHAINARQVADASGYAIEKSNKREDMVSVGKKVQSGVLAYASSIGDAVLLEQVGFTESSILGKRDTAIIDVMQTIATAASGLVAELVPFGVDQALIDALDAKIEAFELIVQKPRTVIGEYAARNKEVVMLMKDIDVLLNGKLHYLLLPFKHTDQVFHDGFKNAMMIIDLGRRKRSTKTKLMGRVVDLESRAVIDGVKVIVSGIRTEEMITKADGMYEFGFGFEEGGSVRIKAMKAEYYDFVKFVDVKKGVVCEMDIEMERVEMG